MLSDSYSRPPGLALWNGAPQGTTPSACRGASLMHSALSHAAQHRTRRRVVSKQLYHGGLPGQGFAQEFFPIQRLLGGSNTASYFALPPSVFASPAAGGFSSASLLFHSAAFSGLSQAV